MEDVQELRAELSATRPAEVEIQSGAWLLELSADWIVLRASENVHHLVGESHVTLIGEPFGRFVHAQALHDLRNLFSRLSGSTGIARAYGVRLTDDRDLIEIAFHLGDGKVLLEAVPSAGAFGEAFGSVGGLIDGLADSRGQALLDGGARRMRALTGYDRVTFSIGDRRAESSRGSFAGPAEDSTDLPVLIADTQAPAVALFPRDGDDDAAAIALMRQPSEAVLAQLVTSGIRATLCVPFRAGGVDGQFRCDCRTVRAPSFEIHAAAELFAQMFALLLEMDAFKNG
jgi:light-regulated signal transduction histidine kinase (bacteriophytochrome)